MIGNERENEWDSIKEYNSDKDRERHGEGEGEKEISKQW